MRMKLHLLASSMLAAMSLTMTASANPLDEGQSEDILLQGFHWLSIEGAEAETRKGAWWYAELQNKASEISENRFDMIWFPPPSLPPSFSKWGYIPTALNDLNSYYGTKAELKSAIDTYHAKGIKVLADIVINHRGGTTNWCDFSDPAWPNAITSGDEVWSEDPADTGCIASSEKGGVDSGENYSAARDVDHSNTAVQDSIKTWMGDLLKNEMGFDGWRYDYIKGYDGKYNGMYNKATSPYFSVGEMWTNYDPDGNFGAKPDDHRQQLLNWVNAAQQTSGIFDFTTKGGLNYVLGYYDGQWKGGSNDYGLLRDSQGRPSGLIGTAPKYAVTFVDNHDTGPSTTASDGQRHWQMNNDKVPEAYAYILTHPGIPTVYWGHYMKMGFKSQIDALIDARKAAGLHSESPITIHEARSGLYAATVEGHNGRLAVKLGSGDWSPADGDWELAASGNGYAVWTETAGNKAPTACFTPNSANGIAVGDAILFDASCSSDSDGSIVSYSWSGAAVGSDDTTTVSFTEETKYEVTLTVTDDGGRSNSTTLTVNLGKDYLQNFPSVFVRGSFNTWAADTEMTLIDDNTWEVKGVEFAADGLFKFDIYGDWKTNFGDNEQDGIADGGDAGDIEVATAGTYDIQFNDDSMAYKVIPAQQGCTADNDGMPKAWEEQYGLDDCDATDALTDLDSDGLNNLAEYKAGTNPTLADTDADGLPDKFEVDTVGLDPIVDDAEADLDSDGYSNIAEYKASTDLTDAADHPGTTTTTTGFTVKHSGDFNGDGTDDLLWRNTETGANWIYLVDLTKAGHATKQYLNTVPTDWSLVALADFNGDGTDDILWHHVKSGEVYVHLMKNGAVASVQRVAQLADTNWKVAGAGDFNGDGKADILWRHGQTGTNFIYLMDGATRLERKVLNVIGTEWSVNAIADINGDGKDDIIWRSSKTGMVYAYLMNGIAVSAKQMIANVAVDTGWSLEATGDFNQDGKDDLVWYNSKTGQTVIYLMNGFASTKVTSTVIPDTNWKIAQVGDFNGDGNADLYWRHSVSGENYLHLMNGTTASQKLPVFSALSSSWSLATGGSQQTGGSVIVVIEQPKEVALSVAPAGGNFTGSVTVTLKVSGGTITTARYTLDGSDPSAQGTAFEDGTQITIGADAAEGSTTTLRIYAENDDDRSSLQSFDFVKQKKVVVVTGGNKPYSTNPTMGKRVSNGAITIDGSGADWGDDMLIAIDAANDDPRSLGSAWSMHETPLDYSHMWAAWDDQYLYIAWQYVNVTDLVDSTNGSSTGPVSANQMPQWIAIDTIPNQGASVDVWGKNFGEPYWTGADKPEYQLYLFTNLWSGMVKAGNQGVIAEYDSATGAFAEPDGDSGYYLFVDQGIEAAYSLGFVPSELWMVGDADDAVDNTIADADLSDAIAAGHDDAKDVFFEIRIPLAALGNPDLDGNNLGIMMGQGDGSPVDTIPNDPATSDTVEVSDSNSPMEWADIDSFTVPFARVGK